MHTFLLDVSVLTDSFVLYWLWRGDPMRKRSRMSNKASKRDFSHKAGRVHSRNSMASGPMRGGIRL